MHVINTGLLSSPLTLIYREGRILDARVLRVIEDVGRAAAEDPLKMQLVWVVPGKLRYLALPLKGTFRKSLRKFARREPVRARSVESLKPTDMVNGAE